MSLITLQNASFDFGREPILRDAELRLQPGERVALVGENGSGKSTLMALLAGDLDLVEGRRETRGGLRLKRLEQETTFDPAVWSGRTVRDMVAALAVPELTAMEEELARLGAELAAATGPAADELGLEHGRLQAEFERREGYTWRTRLEAALSGLGVGPELWGQEPGSLSGGERRRASLAAVLLAEADLLLLDEPTNHLDLAAREWLEAHLQRRPGAVLLVSHDRYFLDRITTRTVEIGRGRLRSWSGNYTSWLKEAAERRRHDEAAWRRERESVARTEDFIRRNIAGQKTKQAQSRRRQLEKLDRRERPEAETRAWKLRLEPARPSGSLPLELHGLAKGYGGEPLFADLDLIVNRGDRLGVVGPNGCGKTTLLKVLAGEVFADAGRVAWGHNVDLGLYDQQLRTVSDSRELLDELADAWPGATLGELRGFAGAFGFGADMIDRPVGALSGGERARLALMRLVREGHNTLLLDEPTNHLDLRTCEALEEALREFDGTLIVVSHDRRFLDRVCDRLLVFEEGDDGGMRLRDHLGNWTDYVRRRRAEAETAPSASKTAARAETSKASGLSKNEIRRREEWIAAEEKTIAALEEAHAALLERLADSDLTPDERRAVGENVVENERDTEAALARWEQWQDEIDGND